MIRRYHAYGKHHGKKEKRKEISLRTFVEPDLPILYGILSLHVFVRGTRQYLPAHADNRYLDMMRPAPLLQVFLP